MALEGRKAVEVADNRLQRAFDRNGQAGLIKQLRAEYPKTKFYWIAGADSFNKALKKGYLDLAAQKRTNGLSSEVQRYIESHHLYRVTAPQR